LRLAKIQIIFTNHRKAIEFVVNFWGKHVYKFQSIVSFIFDTFE